MELTIWEINNLKLELDITDAGTAECYEKALDKLKKEIFKVETVGLKTPAYIRAFCKAHGNLYNVIFGNYASDNIRDYVS